MVATLIKYLWEDVLTGHLGYYYLNRWMSIWLKRCLFPFNKSHWSSWMLINCWNYYFDEKKKGSVIRVGPRRLSEASCFPSLMVLLLWYWQVTFVPSFALWKTGTIRLSPLTQWHSENVTARTEVLCAARNTATCTWALWSTDYPESLPVEPLKLLSRCQLWVMECVSSLW